MSKEFKLPPLDPVLAARLSRGTLFAGNEVEDALRDYATLVADHAAKQEREACALVCDDVSLQALTSWKLRYELQDQGREMGAEDCAAAIRARKPF